MSRSPDRAKLQTGRRADRSKLRRRPQADTAVLAGDVRDAGTREPLAGVVVTLQDYDDKHGRTPECRTDEAGRFRFEDLPASSQPLQRVRVVARKNGYDASDTYTTLGTTSLPVKLRPRAAAKEDR